MNENKVKRYRAGAPIGKEPTIVQPTPPQFLNPPLGIWANGPCYDPRPIYAACIAAGFPSPNTGYDACLQRSLNSGNSLNWDIGDNDIGVGFSATCAPGGAMCHWVEGWTVGQRRNEGTSGSVVDRFYGYGPYSLPE